MIAPARLAAYDILTTVTAGRADLPAAIARARGALRDERDRALAAEISTGVQRQRAALDHLITHFSKRSLDRLDPEIVEILRLSAYQLLHLTRVPAAAVVDDAVDLAGWVGKRSASGLVNAVLRSLARGRRALPLPERPADAQAGNREAALDYLSITLSHPRWLVTRWLDRFGFEAVETWLQFNNTQAPLTLRTNTLRTTATDLIGQLGAEGVRVHPGRFAPDSLIVDEGQPLGGSGLADGWFVVQDEASQLVSLLAGSRPGARVLDTCAAPGGKTTALAAAMGGQGLLVACDVRSRRMKLLRSTVATSRAGNIRLVQADLLKPLPFLGPSGVVSGGIAGGGFDCVLVDAPCSGLGILRRDPDIRWRRGEGDLASLAAAQQTMIAHAARVVAPGGRLVYATCSTEPEENEAVAETFVQSAPDFSRVDLREAEGDLPPAVRTGVIDGHGHLRTSPHLHGLEAFFGAVFRRRP